MTTEPSLWAGCGCSVGVVLIDGHLRWCVSLSATAPKRDGSPACRSCTGDTNSGGSVAARLNAEEEGKYEDTECQASGW